MVLNKKKLTKNWKLRGLRSRELREYHKTTPNITTENGHRKKINTFVDFGSETPTHSIILKNQERNPTPPEDIDPDLFIGADDVVDEDEDDSAGVGLVDNVAVELVSRLNIGTVNLITL